ncbi:FAD-binding oxidoreductase [bacterium AH-315-I20]|nr:FAD-binding oxidoreductase [bacterium AH-315-I20]
MFSTQAKQTDKPIIIVGNGLAGSLLAWTLLKYGADIQIYGDKSINASRVAAGLINPVTGQRFVLADNTPEMLSFAKSFYQNIEQALNISCFHEKPMFRLFSSPKEQENCKKRQKNSKYADFLTQKPIPSTINHEHGGIVQQHTAWLDTNTLLDALHQYFEQQNCIRYQKYTPQKTVQTVMYCEGYQMMNNPLFSWLPLQPAHGEIITCTTDKALPDAIINKSKWLLPIDENTCRVGATYDTKITTPTLLETSKSQLHQFAKDIFKETHAFEVTQHQAGIRPTTLDKQPFIGFHPKYQNIAIFNGFGSRGSLMIPWYAHQLCHNNIPAKANISRYNDLAASVGIKRT